MHVRFSMCRGMPVIADDSDEVMGSIRGIIIHPDLGRIEGFFVRGSGFFDGGELFLSTLDVTHWGTRVRVRSEDALSPLEDHIRLQQLLTEGRPVIGQRIVTTSGASFGRCRDVQFETKTFRLEHIFPRRWLQWRTTIPASAIKEVRSDAIVVRDALTGEPEKQSVLTVIEGIAEAPVPPTPEPS